MMKLTLNVNRFKKKLSNPIFLNLLSGEKRLTFLYDKMQCISFTVYIKQDNIY